MCSEKSPRGSTHTTRPGQVADRVAHLYPDAADLGFSFSAKTTAVLAEGEVVWPSQRLDVVGARARSDRVSISLWLRVIDAVRSSGVTESLDDLVPGEMIDDGHAGVRASFKRRKGEASAR